MPGSQERQPIKREELTKERRCCSNGRAPSAGLRHQTAGSRTTHPEEEVVVLLGPPKQPLDLPRRHRPQHSLYVVQLVHCHPQRKLVVRQHVVERLPNVIHHDHRNAPHRKRVDQALAPAAARGGEAEDAPSHGLAVRAVAVLAGVHVLVVHVEPGLVLRADEQPLADAQRVGCPPEVDVAGEEEPGERAIMRGRMRVRESASALAPGRPQCESGWELSGGAGRGWRTACPSPEMVSRTCPRPSDLSPSGRAGPPYLQRRQDSAERQQKANRSRSQHPLREQPRTQRASGSGSGRDTAAARRTVLILEAALRVELLRRALAPPRPDGVVRAPVRHPNRPSEELRKAPAEPVVVLRRRPRGHRRAGSGGTQRTHERQWKKGGLCSARSRALTTHVDTLPEVLDRKKDVVRAAKPVPEGPHRPHEPRGAVGKLLPRPTVRRETWRAEARGAGKSESASTQRAPASPQAASAGRGGEGLPGLKRPGGLAHRRAGVARKRCSPPKG